MFKTLVKIFVRLFEVQDDVYLHMLHFELTPILVFNQMRTTKKEERHGCIVNNLIRAMSSSLR